MKVTRDPTRQAKKPRAAGSQQPACSHEEHQILSTAEAAAFATQFWDCKVHSARLLSMNFWRCIDVDLEQKVKHAGRQKYTRKWGHQTTYFVPYCGSRRQICKTQLLHYFRISRKVVQYVAKAKAAAEGETCRSPEVHQKMGAPDNVLCTVLWVASPNLQDPVTALLQNFPKSCAVRGQSQSSCGR